jgi:hypothetical protein
VRDLYNILPLIGDGRSIDAVGIGQIKLKVHVGDSEYKDTILRDVYYVPELHANLLSVPRLMKQGLGVTFNENTCTILANGKVAALARKQNSLYILQVSSNEVTQAYIMQGPSAILDADKPCINALTSKVQLSNAISKLGIGDSGI